MPRVIRTKKTSVPEKTSSTSEAGSIWAALSVGTFLVTFAFVASTRTSIEGFVFGSLALLLILFIEGLLRGRVWMFEPRFQKIFEDKKLPVRMLLFTGSVVFLMETIILLAMAIPQVSSAFPFCGSL